MKLEPKYIAPYLSYNLTGIFYFQGKKQSGIWRLCNLSSSGSIQVIRSSKTRVRSECSRPIYEFKPLLLPLLESTISEGDLERTGFNSRLRLISMVRIKAIHWKAIEYLFENHFDVFNLIPDGLAINKNDYK